MLSATNGLALRACLPLGLWRATAVRPSLCARSGGHGHGRPPRPRSSRRRAGVERRALHDPICLTVIGRK
eukprot:scaffold160560_cov31-Tisochrysis_lutea.AAC.3